MICFYKTLSSGGFYKGISTSIAGNGIEPNRRIMVSDLYAAE